MKQLLTVVVILAVTAGSALAQDVPAGKQGRGAARVSDRSVKRVIREVRHELVMLPWYGVFDNLQYRVDPDLTVTLMGQVTRPSLKSGAENAVKKIEGVERVVNEIEVLPPSSGDDRIRRLAFRAIYTDSRLSRYAIQAVPPIHIIVNRGHITLEGMVASAADKTTAGIRANGVAGAFSVTNNLQVEQEPPR